ncbi:hypothetical protein DTO027B5_8240 [Paecilomyces variotii]|nr:hypothetical protein DTO195F2_8586 [Paecilomyces variotii]KAJ9321764.1 hypothetical protein DTO027B3_7289 [Paecilomyces variotii]KAJ9330029.1 hypothetical protein DTO027B5_8240 [Paecilomyces variotii]KAJ9350812.1 hypothetical protein DTO280E4_8541 [Paecilomyces variotii]
MSVVPNGNPLRSANHPISHHEILNKLHRELSQGEGEQSLEWELVDIAVAERIGQKLDRTLENRNIRFTFDACTKTLRLVTMVSDIHECHIPWLSFSFGELRANGLLTTPEFRSISIHVCTRFTGFLGQYTSSRKEPDAHIIPLSLDMPTVVVESGWSESRAQLQRDRDLWLIGGRVNVVIVIKWVKNSSNEVAGDIAVFDLDSQGAVRCLQQQIIFPEPPPSIADAQQIRLTRGQIFGSSLPPGQNAAQILPLELSELRYQARASLRRMGLTPQGNVGREE